MASYSTVSECYVLEGGKYVIEIARNSSDARELYDAADDRVITLNVASDEVTGTKYKNLFQDCSGANEVNAIYMARHDTDGVPTVKEGTYPGVTSLL